ncbi:MAG: DoxX family protein [Cytophagales bacterium]|nr:DoxX family protein [Cytophagales bacterium]
MKINKILYWLGTIVMGMIMAFSVTMYLTKTAAIQGAFEGYGYPAYLVIPLAIAKILGMVAVISGLSRTLKEWAYFGFLIDFVLAATAHLTSGDGGGLFSFIALGAWVVSYVFWKRKEG